MTPIENWVEYSGVVPVERIFSIGEKPRFTSVREVKKQVYVEWRDRLFCLQGGTGFTLMGVARDSSTLDISPLGTTNPWTLQIQEENLPKEPTICFLESNTIKPAPLDFLRKAFDKEQRLTTETFRYE